MYTYYQTTTSSNELNITWNYKNRKSSIRKSFKTQQEKAEQILELVCEIHKLSVLEVKGDSRNPKISIPRHIVSYLIKTHTKLSNPAIGKIMDRHHASIMHSVKVVKNEIETDEQFKQEIELIEKIVIESIK